MAQGPLQRECLHEKEVPPVLQSRPEYLREIARVAGLGPSAEWSGRLKAKHGGSPDDFFKTACAQEYLLEIAFRPDYEHVAKDLGYLLDPAMRETAGLIWVVDQLHPQRAGMIEDWLVEIPRLKERDVIVLETTDFNREGLIRFKEARIFNRRYPNRREIDSAVRDHLRTLCNGHSAIGPDVLQKVLGVSNRWHLSQEHKAPNAVLPVLQAIRTNDGSHNRGPKGGERLYVPGAVHEWIGRCEEAVAREHGVPNVEFWSRNAPRIGTEALTSLQCTKLLNRAYGTVMKKLREEGGPVAFCIGEDTEISLLFPRELAMRCHSATPIE